MAKNTGRVTDDTPAGKLGIDPRDPWYDEINKAAKAGGDRLRKVKQERMSSLLDKKSPPSKLEREMGTDITVADSTRTAIAGGDTTGVIKGKRGHSVIKLHGKDAEGWSGTTVQTKGAYPRDSYFSQNPEYPATGPDSLIYHGTEARKAERLAKGRGWWGGRRPRKKAKEEQALHSEAKERMIEEVRRRARRGD